MKTSLEHLPEPKREQLTAIAALLQGEARAEMVILFGSHARGDWVEDPETGYTSDFDVLVVAPPELARKVTFWTQITQKAQALAGRTPVRIIAHDIKEINHELRLGQYFFIDILRDGIVLFDSRRHKLASPKALTPEDRLKLGLVNFRYWYSSASDFWRSAGNAAGRGLGAQAAFLLHQAVERYFGAVLLVFTGYKPLSHDIEALANQTATLHPALAGALPRTEPEDVRLFRLIRAAYIEARYSKSYRITAEELRTLRERVHDLAVRVHQACSEKLASFCGPDQVGSLLEVPSIADTGDLPAAPSLDDPAAFDAWRDALISLAEQRGYDRGEKAGYDRGKQAGQIEALWSILAARGLPVDAETRARVEACQDAGTLRRWIARAMTAATAADLFARDP